MSYVPLKQPLLEDDGSFDYEETLLSERNEQAKHLAQDIYHLKGAMDDLKMMVDEQGEMLVQADNNVTTADLEIEYGVEELEKAYVYKSRSKKRIIILVVVILLILAVVIGQLFNGKWLPKVSFVPHSPSKTDSKHDECATIDANFTLLDNPYCDEKIYENTGSKVWLNYKKRNYTVSNEAQTKVIFQELLEDIIFLCGFSDSMNVVIEHSITNMVSDIILFSKNGVPKGVIEIKRPPPKELTDREDRKITGQIFDYMLIGITSTYLESEILWLQDDPLIHENNIKKIKENINRIDRKVYKSQVIAQDHPDYVKTLCSVVQKMYYSETNPEEGSNSRYYIQIDSNSWFCVKLRQDIFPNYSKLLDIDTENPSDLEKPLLLEDLGSGGDGKCWIAFNVNSDVFVVKFFKDETNADIEKFFWKEIWDIIDNSIFYRILELVKESCKIFSQKGYFHKDLCKRHVAKYSESDKIKIVFIDLSRNNKK
ncbi:hypothetical protein ACTFIY_004925 [Dictyostelium cf. discoideum]